MRSVPVRKALKILAAVLLVATLVMIVAPRIWVKNKKARLIYKGHTKQDIVLYHGQGGRVLLFPKIAAEAPAMLYDPARGMASCGEGAFADLKLARLELRADSRCTWFRQTKETTAMGNSIRFVSPHGAEMEVEWQTPPR
jgi:hypothetical protein